MSLIPAPYRWLGLGLLVLAIGIYIATLKADVRHYKKLYTSEKTAHKLTVSNYRAAAEKARADDAANQVRVEREQSKANDEVSRDLQKQLADARRRADALRVRLREAEANSGSPRSPAVPGAPDAPGGPDRTSGNPVLSPEDLLTCEINTIKAKGWLDWWERVKAIPR